MTERQFHLFKSKKQRGTQADYRPLEFQTHCMVADTLRKWATPNWVFTHFPSGERRDEVTGARLKRMGVVPGIPDFLLFPPADAPNHRCHFLELKRKGGKLTEHQAAFELWARLNGYPFAVADTYDAAVAVLKQWGALMDRVKPQ